MVWFICNGDETETSRKKKKINEKVGKRLYGKTGATISNGGGFNNNYGENGVMLSLKDVNALHQTLVHALRERKSLATIVVLVNFYPAVLEYTDEQDGFTPLLHACACSPPVAYDVLQYLLQSCPQSLSLGRKDNFPPLHRACCRSDPPMENIQLLVQSMNRYSTYYHHHYRHNLSSSWSLLPSDLSYQHVNGWTPLHCACYYNCADAVIEYLVEQQPVSTLLYNHDARTPRLALDFAKQNQMVTDTICVISLKMQEAAIALAEAALTMNNCCENDDNSSGNSFQDHSNSSLYGAGGAGGGPRAAYQYRKIDMPWKVVAHAAETLTDFLNVVVNPNGKLVSRLAADDQTKPLDPATIRELVSDPSVQACLSQAKYQRLLDGIIQMNKAGRKTYLEHERHNRRKGVVVLTAVSENLDCLFLHLRENPLLCRFQQTLAPAQELSSSPSPSVTDEERTEITTAAE